MRLVKSVARLESAAVLAARGQERPAAVGIVWSEHENKIDVYALADDEFVAVDVVVREWEAPSAEIAALNAIDAAEREAGGLEPSPGLPPRWLIRERVTRDPNDLGSVRREVDGVLLGLVVRLDGPMIAWEPVAVAEGLGAA